MSRVIDELESLLFDWEAGTLDDDGVGRVRDLLRSSEEARRFYVQQQVLGAALKLDIDAGLQPPSPAGPVRPSVALIPGVQQRNYWAVAAVALLIGGLAVRVLQLERLRQEPPTAVAGVGVNSADEPTAEGVALLTRLVDVEWHSEQPALEVGDAIPRGRFAIRSGFAQVEFFCGATVILEGPADLDLQSPLLARVRSGRLRAQVPPAARGFSLDVDDMKVVDLGTEFGLSVSEQGADVQVFDGEVELQQPSTKNRLLTAGNALVRSLDGTFTESTVTPDRFLDIASLESRAENQRDERFDRWESWSAELRSDPRLIAYYAFDQSGGWKRRLDCSMDNEDHELDGAIVGAGRVVGRWESKGGLEFKRPGDRVRVQIPGEFDSLTFACWTKIDSLDRWYNSLFLTDHYNQGEPHWQILDTGQLFFSVRHKADDAEGPAKRGPTHQPVLSPPFWKPSLSGRWVHLATAYDARDGRITHYLNGELLHDETLPAELRVDTTRIGAASIGNWSIPTRSEAAFAIRNLNGSIDEFAIFAAALSADEIKEMYEHGKP